MRTITTIGLDMRLTRKRLSPNRLSVAACSAVIGWPAVIASEFFDGPGRREAALHHICSYERRRNAMLSKENCAAVLNAGSNLRISGLPTSDLVELARIARQRSVRLEIKCGLSPDSMVEIADAGGTNVLLDVSDYR
jgi:hypothetical protein